MTYWCSCCKDIVHGIGDGELPKAYLGPNIKAFVTQLRYMIKLPYGTIRKICNNIFDIDITETAFYYNDCKLSKKSLDIYNSIKNDIINSDSIYADETSWKMNGNNYWLWCLTNVFSALYAIDNSRGSKVPKGLLGNDFEGILMSDFFSAYNLVSAKAKAKCNAHLLRDIEKTLHFCQDDNAELFLQSLKWIIQQGIDAYNNFKQDKLTKDKLHTLRKELLKQIDDLCYASLEDADAERLRKRTIKHKLDILRFLENPVIEPTNNRCERQLRPNVIMRKLTFGNRSEKGIQNHQVMMSILETLKLRGLNSADFLAELITAVKPEDMPEIKPP